MEEERAETGTYVCGCLTVKEPAKIWHKPAKFGATPAEKWAEPSSFGSLSVQVY